MSDISPGGGDVFDGTATPQTGLKNSGLQSVIAKIDDVLGRFEGIVINVSYAVLILIIGVETIRRAFVGTQEVWGPEIALYAFVWLSWFSMAKHGRFGTHLAFTELRQRLSDRSQRALELFDCLLWLLVGLIIVYTSSAVVKNQISMGQTVFGTSIPLYLASLAVPVGWAFSIIRVLQRSLLVVFVWDQLKKERRALINL